MTSAELVCCKQMSYITDKFKYRSKQGGPDQTAPIGAFFFVWFDSLHPIKNLSVKQGGVFLGWSSTKLG